MKTRIAEYIERYSRAREISQGEAEQHLIVKEVRKYYREGEEDAGRNVPPAECITGTGC